jgi:sodium transport system permease protein
VPAAVALAVAFHPLADALRTLVMRLYPINEEMLQALKGLDEAFNNAVLWQALLVVAVLPAVCEELAFRGFILSGFRRSGAKWRAIAYSAIFFGLSHAILQQSLIACVLGLVLGLIAFQTRSLLPGVLFHLVHNGLAVALTRVPSDWFSRWPVLGLFVSPGEQGGVVFEWPAMAIGAAATLALVAWFQRLPSEAPTDETIEPPDVLRAETP